MQSNKMNNKYTDSLKKIQNKIYGKLKSYRGEGIVDCFKEEFRFVRKFDEYKFSKKMTSLGITHLLLDDEYDLTDILEADIINPIRRGSNMTFGIKGFTGTGKSEGAIKIALLSKIANKKYKNRDTNGFYGFHLDWDKNNFEKTLKILKEGDIVLKDEMPKHMGKGRLTQKWSIENVLDTVRMMENTFIFVDPKNIKMDCDILLEAAGMDEKARINRFMILDEEKESKPNYYGHVFIKLHDNNELRTWYEKEKKKFIKRNLKIGGKFKVDIIDAELEEDPNKIKIINKELEEKLNYLWDNYIPEKIPEKKERNIIIWYLHQLEFKDKDISDISGLTIGRIRQIYIELDEKFT